MLRSTAGERESQPVSKVENSESIISRANRQPKSKGSDQNDGSAFREGLWRAVLRKLGINTAPRLDAASAARAVFICGLFYSGGRRSIRRDTDYVNSCDFAKLFAPARCLYYCCLVAGIARLKGVGMAGTILNIIFLGLVFSAAAICIVGPLAVLAIMFWHWQKELSEITRLRQARSTQIR
jgi:hypothetical protein